MVDAHKNFAYSTVATAPSPATTGTSLVVAAGEGTRFPAVPFNAVIWPTGAIPLPSNAEIVRVTAIVTDTFTITRAQESTTARSVVVGDQIAAAITAKVLTDAELDTAVFWDAKGDLAVGTGADAASRLPVGVNDTILMADSAQATGLKWAAAATPSTQALGDAAAEGIADTFTRGDHKHAIPAAATQAQQETGTDVASPVTPGRQHFHPSSAKCWAKATINGTLDASYNMTSVTDVGTGQITFTVATDFSSVDWVFSLSSTKNSVSGTGFTETDPTGHAAGTLNCSHYGVSETLKDPQKWHMIGFGDFV